MTAHRIIAFVLVLAIVMSVFAFGAPVAMAASKKVKAPTRLKAKQVSETTISLTWKKVAKATKYQVYRKFEDGRYRKIATVKSAKYKDKKIEVGTTYSYKIRAYRTIKKKKYYSKYSAAVKLTAFKHVKEGSE